LPGFDFPIHPIGFFASSQIIFQFDRIKRAALSSPVYGVFFSAHHSTTDFRNNFL
jgi:hypothetical protein